MTDASTPNPDILTTNAVTRSHTRIESQKEGGQGSGTKTTDWDEEELEYQNDEENLGDETKIWRLRPRKRWISSCNGHQTVRNTGLYRVVG
jgi:hypothetical protein